MADCCNPTVLFVLIRAVHFAACLLLFSVWLFDRVVTPTGGSKIDPRRWTLLLMPVVGITGVAWFMVLCVNMSGLPVREAMSGDTIRLVWGATRFGRLWEWRFVLWIGLVGAFGPLSREAAGWGMVALTGALAGSLAWAGHGGDGGGWHVLADAVHLVVGGAWPAMLVPLLVVLVRRDCTARMLRRFSTISVVSVAILFTTGVVNACFLIATPKDLISTGYGKVLLAKVFVFLLMVCIGASNRARLSTVDQSDAAAMKLRRNAIVEVGLATAVLLLTSALGLMATRP